MLNNTINTKLDNITLESALSIVEGCKDMQTKNKLPPVNIAVVDSAALLVAFNRQDGALKGSIEVSLMKAKSSAMFCLTTSDIKVATFGGEGQPATDPGMASIPGVLPVPGGIPIVNDDGLVIGAVGVSGANDLDDERCSLAGIAFARSIV